MRSYVKQLPLARRPGSVQGWYRPQAQKIMTVELVKPFQWPAVPDDLAAWNKDMFDQRQDKIEDNRRQQKLRHEMTLPLKSRLPLTDSRKSLAALAEKMLTGETEWSNGVTLDSKWDSILAAAEGKKETQSKEEKKAVDAKDTTT